jgi:hypothetical protein
MSLSVFSVTTPATETSLLSIQELRDASGVEGNSRDATLLLLGRSASMSIARWCNVRDDGVNPPTLLRETCSETFRWSSCGPLSLSRWPVSSIVSVSIDGSSVDSSMYEVWTRNFFYLIDDEQSDWPSGRIVVSYVAGYQNPPSDLKLAASKLVTSLFSETGRDPSLRRESIPGVIDQEFWVAPSSDPLMSREIMDLMSPYTERFV